MIVLEIKNVKAIIYKLLISYLRFTNCYFFILAGGLKQQQGWGRGGGGGGWIELDALIFKFM